MNIRALLLAACAATFAGCSGGGSSVSPIAPVAPVVAPIAAPAPPANAPQGTLVFPESAARRPSDVIGGIGFTADLGNVAAGTFAARRSASLSSVAQIGVGGTVYGAIHQNGQPAANALVLLVSTDFSNWAWGWTDASGSFSIGSVPGDTYMVAVNWYLLPPGAVTFHRN